MSEWMDKHKGKLWRTSAYIWYCDDDVCGCYQAQHNDIWRNKVTGNTYITTGIWEGTFRTEHESAPCVDDLVRYRRELKKTNPELEARTEWQSGIDYDKEVSDEGT